MSKDFEKLALHQGDPAALKQVGQSVLETAIESPLKPQSDSRLGPDRPRPASRPWPGSTHETRGCGPNLSDYEITIESKINEVNLRFARAAGVLHRVIDERDLNQYDELAMENAALLLERAADDWEYFGDPDHQDDNAWHMSGTRPAPHHIASFVARITADDKVEPDNLRRLAEALRTIVPSPDADIATSLLPAFSKIHQAQEPVVWDDLPQPDQIAG